MRQAINGLLAAALACGVVGGSGCAGDRAAFQIAKESGVIMQTMVEKSPLDRVNMHATGRLQDPHYRGTVLWVTGMAVDIGLDGAFIEGDVSGSGQGADQPLSEAARAAIRELMAEPYWSDALGQALAGQLAKNPATQPAGGGG